MKKIFTVLLFCLVAATVTACNIFNVSSENVSGLLTTTFTQFEDQPISGISVSGIWNATITQGASTKVTITIPEKYKDWYSFSLDRGTLVVTQTSNHTVGFKYTKGNNPFKLDIVCSSLENIKASGGSKINMIGDFNSEILKINSSGGSDITGAGKITCAEAVIDISGGSDVDINATAKTNILMNASGGSDLLGTFYANSIEVNISGGADVELIGATNTLLVSASGGADFTAVDLVAQNVDVTASGGADVGVNAIETLKVSKSGGADVAYKGNPTIHQQVKGLKKLD